MRLFQPVYEYDKDVYGRKVRMQFLSSVVYETETEEQAKMCALDTWSEIKSYDETLLNITFRQLVIHHQ